MDKARLIDYLTRLDHSLQGPVSLCVYGSAALILLDEPDRTSVGVDVAGPHSHGDQADLVRAAESAGLPVDPAEDYAGDHIEWVSGLRLCLERPDSGTEIVLWQGSRLTVKTVSVPALIASKLIRYDDIDQADIQFLVRQAGTRFGEVESAVRALPPPFARDSLVRENLENLRTDMASWEQQADDPA